MIITLGPLEYKVFFIYFTFNKEIGAKTEVLNPLEGLTKEEQEKGLDFIDVMKNNLEALKLSF